MCASGSRTAEKQDIWLLGSLPLESLLNCPRSGGDYGWVSARWCPTVFRQAAAVLCTENVELPLKKSRARSPYEDLFLLYTHLQEIRVLKVTPAL